MLEDISEAEKRRKKIKGVAQNLLSNRGGLMERVSWMQFLEKEMKVEFKNTKDYEEKMGDIITRIGSAEQLELKRNELGLTVGGMARRLDIPKFWLEQMEKGTRRLNKKVHKFVHGE